MVNEGASLSDHQLITFEIYQVQVLTSSNQVQVLPPTVQTGYEEGRGGLLSRNLRVKERLPLG